MTDRMTDQVAVTVLHVARAFSAQPTLGECLGSAAVIETPMAEAMARGDLHPDLVWVSAASAADVRALREHYPRARILATPQRGARSEDVVELIREADLVLTDGGVVVAAAGLQALSRRLVRAA